MTTSRLYRRMKPVTGGNIFTFYNPEYSAYDTSIMQATIHRGSASPQGYTPSTLELEVAEAVTGPIQGKTGMLRIRETQAQRLAAKMGVLPQEISTRFEGRMATTDVTDISDIRKTSKITGSSWIAQMNNSPRTVLPQAGWSIKRLMQEALNAFGIMRRGITPEWYGDYDEVSTSEQSRLTWENTISKYVEEIGIQGRETRDGRTQFFTLEYLDSFLKTKAATAVPIGRHQAVSPASWQILNSRPPASLRYTVTAEGGYLATREIEASSYTGEMVEIDTKDWAHIKTVTRQTGIYARKLVNQQSISTFTVPTIKVDISLLIRLGDSYSLKLAGYLLKLETWDPIGFTGDWPSRLQGWHVATGITETISPDGWIIELSLTPWASALGSFPPPTPAPVIWDQASGTWDQASGTWESFVLGE
ncbi:hypothetical protein [Rothia nasimurium]|uniref:hypothetical protein n=1 Tax=Rothia nasimurium TaxID=85336 RepID=UPI001F3268A6|nr:hypothetical protein [Rothia nasimurium]